VLPELCVRHDTSRPERRASRALGRRRRAGGSRVTARVRLGETRFERRASRRSRTRRAARAPRVRLGLSGERRAPGPACPSA
jgi:hypothetical protein